MLYRIRKKLPGTVYLVFVFAAVIFLNLLTTEKIGRNENVFLLIVTLEIAAFVLPSIIYCHVQGFEYTKGLELKIPELNKIPIVVSGLFAMISLNILLSLLLFSSGAGGSARRRDAVCAAGKKGQYFPGPRHHRQVQERPV